MNESTHNKAAEIFDQAVTLPTSERADYLDTACGGNPGLREEVDELLRHANAGSTVLRAPDGTSRLKAISQALTMPEHVGPYTLIGVLGDGGMAIVYLAEQEKPERLVALKMIKPGMDSVEILRRFDSERDALASMRHAGISTIFDAGMHADGRSWFVMEYVKGTDIVTYCRTHRLTVHERLALMIKVCEATTHAHQKGVIHRDLKPSNILVSDESGNRQPKIIDFGISRVVGKRADEDSGLTRHNQVLGTPDYMSPEQASSSAPDVDTRTDVFSIGVVLYELLVGRLPQKPAAGTMASAMRKVTSTVTASGTLRKIEPQTLSELAGERRSSTRQLLDALDGDLNWVLNKALEPQRDRRYPTVSALAEDLNNVAHGRAVSAHPPSRAYQLKCFLRSHVIEVGAAAAVLVVLAISTIGLAIGFSRADEARELAVEARFEAEAAQLQADRHSELARLESHRANEVTEFLIDLFDVASPSNPDTSDLNARELLRRGVENIQSGLQDQPLVRASLLETMARVHLNLGQYAEAGPLAAQALTLTGRQSEERYLPARIQAHRTRGLVHFYQGEYQAAEAMYRRALELHERAMPFDAMRDAELRHNLGNAIFEQGQLKDALGLFEEALRIRTEQLPENHTKIAESLNSVASAQRRLGRLDDALENYRQSLSMRRALNQHVDPATAITLSNLGVIHFNLRQFDQAETYLEQALRMQRQVFADDHPQIGTVLANLGATLAASKQLDKAKRTLTESVAWHRNSIGNDHPNTANALLNLGSVLQQRGELSQSETLFRECIDIYTRSNAANTPVLGIAMANLSDTLLRRNQPVEALKFAEASHEQLAALLPQEHPWLAVANAAVGAASGANGDADRAVRLLTQSLPALVATFGEDGSRTVAARGYLEQLGDAP